MERQRQSMSKRERDRQTETEIQRRRREQIIHQIIDKNVLFLSINFTPSAGT